MNRFLKPFFAVLLALALMGGSAISEPVFAKTTSDPNHKGWTGKHPKSKQVAWKQVEAKCKNCSQMVAQYNNTMTQLLISRYWVNFWREVAKGREKGKANPFWSGKGDINEFDGKVVGANLELFELQEAQLELHKNLVKTLEQQASYLRGVIIECELTACGKAKKPKIKDIKIGGESIKQPWQPDLSAILAEHGVDWKGPYKTNCLPCKPIVVQLNAVPGWVSRAHFKLKLAEQQLAYAELVAKSNKVSIGELSYNHPDKSDFSHLKSQVAKYRAELTALKKLFEKLLVDLSVCEKKYCSATKTSNISLSDQPLVALGAPDICNSPAAHESITVGANSDVGSSANFKEKAKKKLAGAAIGAVANLIGFGGGGGKDPGPQTYKDPVKKKNKTRVRDKAAKRDFYTGGVFTPDGLLLSTDIKKAPGKGTFHEIYLENASGWRLMPIGFYLYEIWRDWKLSVSWTKDTFVDGELVRHEEGGWTESWRELIARGEEVVYGEVFTAPVWEQLGFTTAVSGARSLGAQFPVSPQMLVDEPWNLVVHVSDPKKDPVVTVPYLFQLSLDEKGRVVTEQVDSTIANQGIDCNKVMAQLDDAAAAINNDNTSKVTSDNEPQHLGFSDNNTIPTYFANQQQVVNDLSAADATVNVGTQAAFLSVLEDVKDSWAITHHRTVDGKQMISLIEPGESDGIETALSVLIDQPKSKAESALLEVAKGDEIPTVLNPNLFMNIVSNSSSRNLGEYPILSASPENARVSTLTITFSEPMNTATVEDNFIIRSLTESSGGPEVKLGSEVYIWDSNAFDTSWEKDDTEATFVFSERVLPEDEGVDTQAEAESYNQFLQTYLENTISDDQYYNLLAHIFDGEPLGVVKAQQYRDETQASSVLKEDPDPDTSETSSNVMELAIVLDLLSDGKGTSEVTELRATFDSLIAREDNIDNYAGRADIDAKKATVEELNQLAGDLVASGLDEDSAAVAEVTETAVTLERQIGYAERELADRKLRFSENLVQATKEQVVDGKKVDFENQPQVYLDYKEQKEAEQREKENDSLQVVSAVDIASGTSTSHELSNRDARAVLDKHKKLLDD